MHDETIAIHFGYQPDSTRAVAVPIYQTVAHDFIDAEHAGAVFDLEVPGFHYNRINNPTNDVLEKRLAALEGGTAALVVASGMAAVSYSILTVALAGSNFVVAPQLYGATFTYFAHVLPTLGHRGPVRRRRPGRVDPGTHRRPDLRGVLRDHREPGRQRRRPRGGGGRGPRRRGAADRRQHRGHAADAEADRPRRRRRGPLADQVHRRPRHHRSAAPSWTAVGSRGASTPSASPCSTNRSRPSTTWCSPGTSPSGRSRCGPGPSSCATPAPPCRPSTPSNSSRGWRRWPSGSSGTRPTPGRWPPTWPPTRGWSGSASPGFRTIPTTTWSSATCNGRVPSIITFGARRGLRRRVGLLRRAAAVQAAPQPGRRQVAGHPSGLDHPPPAQPGRAGGGGHPPETIRLSIGLEHIDDLIEDIDQALTQANA